MHAIIDFENGDTLSLTFNEENQIIIDNNSIIGGQNLGSPPAGVYTLDKEGLFDILVETYTLWQYDKTHNKNLTM